MSTSRGGVAFLEGTTTKRSSSCIGSRSSPSSNSSSSEPFEDYIN